MVTVILVRHADIDLPPPVGSTDPPLNAAGMVRAAELARVLGDSGVSAIFTSGLLRSKQTAAPLAGRLGVPAVVKAWNPPEIAQLRAGVFGEVVLIVGHSNTLPTIIDALTGAGVVINEAEFDNLFIVSIETAMGRLLRLKYGA